MEIRRLETSEEFEQLYRLTYDEFLKMNYIEPRLDKRFVHFNGRLDHILQTDVIGAFENEDLIGTNTLTSDSDTYGLHMNREFPLQIMRERNVDKSLGSAWRLVTRSDRRDGSSVIRRLFSETIKRMRDRRLDTLLCTFNPRHMCHYHLALNMDMIGFNEHTEGLINAPTVLMRGYIDQLPARWLTREL